MYFAVCLKKDGQIVNFLHCRTDNPQKLEDFYTENADVYSLIYYGINFKMETLQQEINMLNEISSYKVDVANSKIVGKYNQEFPITILPNTTNTVTEENTNTTNTTNTGDSTTTDKEV